MDRALGLDCLHRLSSLKTNAAGCDLRAYEGATTEELLVSLVPTVSELQSDLEDVLASNDFGLLPVPVRNVLTLAIREFTMARERTERLSLSSRPWAVLWTVGDALGRLITLVDLWLQHLAVELKVTLEPSESTDHAVALRMQYAKLTKPVVLAPPPTPGELVPRFRTIGTLMAMLVGHASFERARPRDSLAILAFQARIVEWLRAPNPTIGLKLWTDMKGLSIMLRQISLRQELREHDRRVLTQASKARKETLADSQHVVRALRPLLGLDESLDSILIGDRKDVDFATLDAVLAPIRITLECEGRP